ncbi:Inner kinetochore subunit fta4 like protein [Verticillium longisporum]|uniref:Inner kinetochore subunit fta4 like protein n=1 Tax=Verticillium longisporum TaxID=100787 RepID=A0A8I2Z246_VERLO|nr:Inner kinetochore subunit fta4 like protein [Verticillium longisporum]
MALNAPVPHALPTVISLKQAFLESQTRLLSRDLTPTRRWRADNAAAVEPLPVAGIDDALLGLAQILQQHARRIYPPQSTRLIAEQIDKLYQTEDETTTWDSDELLASNADLTDENSIASLPPTWPLSKDLDALPMEAKRYADHVSVLNALVARRTQVHKRVEQLRRLEKAIQPFRISDDGLGLQENVVTRGGEVERELERMRMLLVRVSGRIASLPTPNSEGRKETHSIAGAEADKIQQLLREF